MSYRNSRPAGNSIMTRLTFQGADGLVRCHGIDTQFLNERIEQGIVTPLIGYSLTAHCDAPSPGSGVDCMRDIMMRTVENTFHEIPFLKTPDYNVTRAFVELFNHDGTPSNYDPRHFLNRMIKAGRDEFNLVFRVGFEEEFYLAKDNDGDFVDNLLMKSQYCSHKLMSF